MCLLHVGCDTLAVWALFFVREPMGVRVGVRKRSSRVSCVCGITNIWKCLVCFFLNQCSLIFY